MDKFLGIGLTNAIGLFFLFVLLLVGLKAVAQAYQVPGLKDVMAMV